MRLVPISLEYIPRNKYDKSKIFKTLQIFSESEEVSVRLDFECPDEYASSSSAFATFHKAIKHYGFSDIKVIQRKNDIYLIKKSAYSNTLEDK